MKKVYLEELMDLAIVIELRTTPLQMSTRPSTTTTNLYISRLCKNGDDAVDGEDRTKSHEVYSSI